MVDESVVELGLKYLGECRRNGKRAKLVEMLEYIDYYDRLIANEEEINAILEQSPGVFLERSNGLVDFSAGGVERTISREDAVQAYEAYDVDFKRRLSKLNAKDKLRHGEPES